jgi:hypothetical protein
MITLIAIALLLLTLALSLGGGLYEVQVIYPAWKNDVHPQTLRAKLDASGMNMAAKRFWPIVSPAQGFLSIVNVVLACNYTGPAHAYWLTAGITVLATRIITFAYFIPEMLRKIMKPERIEPARLRRIVRVWLALSPWRLLPELVAFGLLVAALMRMG